MQHVGHRTSDRIAELEAENTSLIETVENLKSIRRSQNAEIERLRELPAVDSLSRIICEARNAWVTGDVDDQIAEAVHRFLSYRLNESR